MGPHLLRARAPRTRQIGGDRSSIESLTADLSQLGIDRSVHTRITTSAGITTSAAGGFQSEQWPHIVQKNPLRANRRNSIVDPFGPQPNSLRAAASAHHHLHHLHHHHPTSRHNHGPQSQHEDDNTIAKNGDEEEINLHVQHIVLDEAQETMRRRRQAKVALPQTQPHSHPQPQAQGQTRNQSPAQPQPRPQRPCQLS